MSVRPYKTKKGEQRYHVIIWKKNRAVKSKSFEHKALAKEWERKEYLKLEELKAGLPKGTVVTLSEFFQQTFLPSKRLRASTLEGYIGMFKKYVEPQFAHKSLSDISTEEWSQFLLNLTQAGHSPVRANRIRTMLSSIYSKALKLNYVSEHPIEHVEKFDEPLPKTNYWTEEEVRKFFSYVRTVSLKRYLIYRIACELGLRRGEVLALRRDCINLDNGIVIIRASLCNVTNQIQEITKGGDVRSVRIASKLFREELRLYLSSHSHDLAFCDESGKPLTGDHIKHFFKKDMRGAGVRPIRFHDLRHTYATLFTRNGGNIYELQKLLGHSSVDVTANRYAHFDEAYLQSSANIVNFDLDEMDGSKKPA